MGASPQQLRPVRLPTRMRCAWSTCAPVPCKRRTRRDTASSPGWTSGQYPVSQQNPAPNAPVHAANVNAPLQVCVAGADEALERVLDPPREHGAHRVRRLAVPTPSHTPLMAPVAAKLERALAAVSMVPPAVPYLSNVGGRALRDPEEIRRPSPERRMAGPLARRYYLALRARCPTVRRAAAGRVLTDLATVAFPEARAIAVADAGVGSAVTLIARHQPDRRASR